MNLRSFCSHLETAALEFTDYDYGMAYGSNTYRIVHVVFHSRMS